MYILYGSVGRSNFGIKQKNEISLLYNKTYKEQPIDSYG
jgi:hypothetical protein